MLAPIAALAMLTIIIGLGAEFVFRFALQAAEELSHPEYYVHAVLGKQIMNLFLLNIFLALGFSAVLGQLNLSGFVAGFIVGYFACG